MQYLRTIAPTTRGFGETRFLSLGTPRTGNAAMLVLDAIEMLDGLGVTNFSVAGHDWGANMTGMLAAGWPDRVDRIAMLSSPPALGGLPPPARAPAMVSLVPGYQAWRADGARRPQGVRPYYVGDMVAEGLVRRCYLRSGGSVVRQSRLGRCDAAQLPLALGRSRARSRQQMAPR